MGQWYSQGKVGAPEVLDTSLQKVPESKMKTFTHWLLRWHALPLMAVVLGLTVPLVFLVRGTSSGDTSTSWGQFALLAVLLIAVAAFIVRLLVMLSGVDPDANTIAERLVANEDQQRLLARWLQRTRWARNVGGVSGLAWWAVGTSAQGDVLLCGVAGIAVGSMAAQLHQVRRPKGPRTASLDARSVGSYIPSGWQRRMIVVSVLAAGMTIGSVVVDDAGSALAWGLTSLVVLGLAHLVQRRVAGRPRSALGTTLQRADDLARQLAIDRGLAQPATYFALALFAHGVRAFEASFGGAATAISVVAWLYALHSWWQNRRLGLDHFIDQPDPIHTAVAV